MKKIAIITTGIDDVLVDKKMGGGEFLLKNLIFELLKMQDVSVHIFTPDEKEIADLKNIYPDLIFRIYQKSYLLFDYVFELEEIFKKEHFDKIINYNMTIPYKTTILQSHSYIHKLNKTFILFRPIKNFILRNKISLQKKAFERAKTESDFIAVSNKIKEDYSKNFNIAPEKIITIYPGVNQNSLKKYKKNNNLPLVFGIVANSSINKGGHYLLFALGVLNIFCKNFKLIMIAPKYKKDILMQFIITIFNMRKKVEVLPFQNDMTYFYDKTDVLVLPSLNEAFGLVVLEAMSNYIPCIVSSTAGSTEIMNNSDGFIFNRSSFIDFLKKLYKIIEIYNTDFTLFQNMCISSKQTSKKYTWHKFTKKAME